MLGIPTANPIFQGGIGLMALGGVITTLKQFPARIGRYISTRVTVVCDIRDTDDAYHWFLRWVHTKYGAQESNALRMASFWENNDGTGNVRRTLLLPGPGERILQFEGAKIWMRIIEEGEAAKRATTITLRCRTRHRAVLEKLLHEIDTLEQRPNPELIRVMRAEYGSNWRLHTTRSARSLDSVILADTLVTDLQSSLKQFEESAERYSRLDIPYRIGCIFEGPPGSGKSSLAAALAGWLQRDLYVLNLGDSSLDDDKLLQLMSAIPKRGVVVIEDIDAVFKGRDRKAENKLTLSGLLNTIDGPFATEGRVLIATTNHVENLDPALIRAGRFDIRAHLGNANQDQAERLFVRFFPEATESASAFATWAGNGTQSMAALQAHLVAHMDTDARVAACAPA